MEWGVASGSGTKRARGGNKTMAAIGADLPYARYFPDCEIQGSAFRFTASL